MRLSFNRTILYLVQNRRRFIFYFKTLVNIHKYKCSDREAHLLNIIYGQANGLADTY